MNSNHCRLADNVRRYIGIHGAIETFWPSDITDHRPPCTGDPT